MTDKQKIQEELAIDPDTGFINEVTADLQPATPSDASLDQVRDILVGPLSRGLEDRLTRVEQRLDRSVLNLTEQITNRINVLEGTLRGEMERLTHQFGEQQELYSQQAGQVRKDMDEGVERIQSQVRQATDDLTGADAKIRIEMAEELETVRTEIEQLMATLTGSLNAETMRLRGELVDRASLASALSEVAVRLTGGSAEIMPGDEDDPDIDLDHLIDGACDED